MFKEENLIRNVKTKYRCRTLVTNKIFVYIYNVYCKFMTFTVLTVYTVLLYCLCNKNVIRN